MRARRYTHTVSAFLAANRCGGRYLIAVADEMSKLGVISLVWYFELSYEVGYTSIWWGLLEGPALILMAISGWVIYRFRQTRALTLAQFFEMRYSRNFRVFAGVVAYAAGIINFGIFPSVGARFFSSLCGLPEHYEVLGVTLATFPTLMVLLLGVSLLFTFLGGQIAVMVTDFIQGTFANIVFVVLMLFLLLSLDWTRIGEVLLSAPPGKSMVDPLDLGAETHFNFWYYVIGVVIMFYCARGWQGTAGYNCAAKDAHEAKMAGILAGWRFRVLMLIALVLPICVRTFLEHPDFAAQAAPVHASLNAIENPALQNQLRTPLAMSAMLPAGLLGLACAALLAAFISTHDTYLHSWGSILVQDVILPFRKRAFTPRQHLWLLRLSIFGVAVFIFLFSLLFEHKQFVSMFLAITGAIFVGGAGAAIVGGLYWSRGTAAAAWGAMITGMTLSLAGIVAKQIDPEFFLTGQVMTFWAIAASGTVYVLVSLFGPRRVHNMDKLLRRGRYAVQDEVARAEGRAPSWLEKLGFTREFTGRDRVVTYITLSWPLVWTVIFIGVTAFAVVRRQSGNAIAPESWLAYWHGWTWFVLACGAVVTVWFTVGGIRDLREMFRRLRTSAEDPHDDGRVEHAHEAPCRLGDGNVAASSSD